MKQQLFVLALALSVCLSGCTEPANLDAVPTATPTDRVAGEEASWGFDFLEELPQASQAGAHPVAASFAGGDGTAENPYQIGDADQLALLAQYINGPPENYDLATHYQQASYILTADITWNDTAGFDSWTEQAPAYAWEPIGMYQPFQGSFDGGGHTISGLYLASTWHPGTTDAGSQPSFGLFGRLAGSTDQTCTVRNVSVTCSLYQIFNVAYHIGGIAGDARNARVEHCTFDGTILCRGGNNAGGIVGEARQVDLTDCTFSGALRGEVKVYYMAGIAARATGGTMDGCVNDGALSPAGESLGMGGIVAELTDATEFVSDKAEGDMSFTVEGHDVRALTTLSNCTNRADLLYGGGIAGQILAFRADVVVSGCVNEGRVGVDNPEMGSAGGIVGRVACYGDDPETRPGLLSRVEIRDCANSGAIQADEGSSLAGIVGTAATQDGGTLLLTGCTNTGAVSGASQLGGILGNLAMYGASTVALENCANSGAVTGKSGSVGGLAGAACFVGSEGGRSFLCAGGENTGAVSGTGYGVGGILGTSLEQKGVQGETYRLEDCANRGTVTGYMPCIAGGIVGYLPAGGEELSLTGCASTGIVQVIPGAEGWALSPQDPPGYYALAGGIAGAAQDTLILQRCTASAPQVDPSLRDVVLTGEDMAYTFDQDPILPLPAE